MRLDRTRLHVCFLLVASTTPSWHPGRKVRMQNEPQHGRPATETPRLSPLRNAMFAYGLSTALISGTRDRFAGRSDGPRAGGRIGLPRAGGTPERRHRPRWEHSASALDCKQFPDVPGRRETLKTFDTKRDRPSPRQHPAVDERPRPGTHGYGHAVPYRPRSTARSERSTSPSPSVSPSPLVAPAGAPKCPSSVARS